MNTQYSISTAILIIVLFIAVYTDLKWRRIFNWLTFPTILLGIILHGVAMGIQGLCFAGAGIGVACLALVLFLFSGAIGAGDVKLLWAIGALMGPRFMCWTLLFTALAGGVCGVVYAARRGVFAYTVRNAISGGHALTAIPSKETLEGMARTSLAGKMPYAPAVAMGVAIAAILIHGGII